jgi:uncharacterized membrane protein
VMMQKLMHCLAALICVLSCAAFFRNQWLKILLSVSLFFYFTWWNIVGWSDNLLSESLSMSFMYLWFAALLFFIRKRSWPTALLLAVTGFLFSFTRDSWPYMILLVYAMLFLFFFRRGRALRFQSGLLLAVALITFFFQQHTAQIGERYKLPVFNSIAERISKDPEYIAWFREHGMPQSEQIVADFSHLRIDTREGQAFIYNRYEDSTYNPLMRWVVHDGKSVYSKFVLTHPSYFLLSDQSSQDRARIFSHSLNKYTLKQTGFFTNAENFFPLFSPWLILLLLILLVLIYWRWERSDHLLFPVLIGIMTLANVYLLYNADGLEVDRHLYITEVILQWNGILAVFFLAEAAYARYKSKRAIPA